MNVLVISLVIAASTDGSSVYERGNLLRGATVTRQEGAPDVARMADGVAPTDGDVWDSPNTAVFKAGGVVEWDLGGVFPIAAARIQADNNDRYIVSGSVDGATWNVLWAAKPVELPGVQTRTSEELTAQARFVRLTAEGGDSMYSIGELEIFDSTSALVGAQLKRIEPPKPPPPPEPPPCNSGLGVVLAVAAFGAYQLWRARERNLEAAKPPAPAEPPPEEKK